MQVVGESWTKAKPALSLPNGISLFLNLHKHKRTNISVFPRTSIIEIGVEMKNLNCGKQRTKSIPNSDKETEDRSKTASVRRNCIAFQIIIFLCLVLGWFGTCGTCRSAHH
jgi:hypothetical protein